MLPRHIIVKQHLPRTPANRFALGTVEGPYDIFRVLSHLVAAMVLTVVCPNVPIVQFVIAPAHGSARRTP